MRVHLPYTRQSLIFFTKSEIKIDLFALKPLSKNIYDEYLASILEKSRGQFLKVPLDVARDINLPAIVANNQKEEKLALRVMNEYTPQRTREFKSPPRIQRQETFVTDSEEEEDRPPKKQPKSPSSPKSPPQLSRAVKPSTLFTPDKIVQKAKELFLQEKPAYAKQLSETAKSQKASVDSQVGAIQFIGPQTADTALALEFSKLRI
jgi:hypothetical protein